MVLLGTLITRDPTGAIGIGLTDTGATIEKVPSGSLSPRPQLQSILDGGNFMGSLLANLTHLCSSLGRLSHRHKR